MAQDDAIIELLATERNKATIRAKGSSEINLIDTILANAAKKLKLFLVLPMLIQNEGAALKSILSEDELDQIKILLDAEYYVKLTTGLPSKKASDEDLMFYSYNDANLGVLFNRYKADPDLEPSDEDRQFYKILNKLYCKPKIINLCQRLIDVLPNEATFVIGVMSELREIMIKKMKESPNEEREREKELSDMVQYSEWAKDELEILSRKFAIAMNKQAQKIGEKCKEADQIQDRTEAVMDHSKDMADFLSRTAENKMIWERKKSEYVQESLALEEKKLEAEFDYIFSQNITKEKNLRVKRYKTEAQLITILKKYDVDIKEREKAYKELITVFNEEQKQLAEIKEQFETQAVEYYALMDEKEEYEQAQWEEKLHSIQMRLAARRIQRYYRGYVALCQSAGYVRFKKRGKSKKKK